MSEPAAPRHFRSMAGQSYELGPMKLAFKPSETEVEGAYSLIEAIEPPGASVALHRHPSWQETFVVLDGRFDFVVEGARHALGPGEILVVPRGAVHGFTCTSPDAGRVLTISTPSRVFEAFVAEVSAANRDPSIDVHAVFARHGLELLAAQPSQPDRPRQAPSARHFRPMEGKTYQLGRMTMAFKRTDGEDEGSYSIIESVEPPGAGAGRHRHPSWQETFLVLEGSFEFEEAGERRSMGAGEMLVIPRGAPHGFTCTSEKPGRLLTISTPARVFEAGVAELCASNVDTGTPQGGPAKDLRALAARHGLEFL